MNTHNRFIVVGVLALCVGTMGNPVSSQEKGVEGFLSKTPPTRPLQSGENRLFPT